MLNFLEDFSDEKSLLEGMQKAMLNILDELDAEERKVERANVDLVRDSRERCLTEHARTERWVERSRSNADLKQFAYAASHDLQEPLRMASQYAQPTPRAALQGPARPAG